ncbi:MAG: caspase family protein, partial [Chloroflexota bacterium]
DGEDLGAILKDPAIAAFDEVSHLHNQSSSQIRRAIVGFYREKKKEDLLFFYFSGHGVLSDSSRQLYFAVRDTEKAYLSANGIEAGFVDRQMKQCRSRRKIVVLDCCYSGAYLQGSKGDDAINTGAIFDPKGYGHYILTATDRLQQAWEGHKINPRYRHSLFTHHLIEGLATGAAGRPYEPHIAMDDLQRYINRQVLEEENRERQQTPKSWSGEVAGELFIAQNVAFEQPVSDVQELSTGEVWQFITALPNFNLHATSIDLGLSDISDIGSLLEAVNKNKRNSELLNLLWRAHQPAFENRWGGRDRVSYKRSVEPAPPDNGPNQKEGSLPDPKPIPPPRKNYDAAYIIAAVGGVIALLIVGAIIFNLFNGTLFTNNPATNDEEQPAAAEIGANLPTEAHDLPATGSTGGPSGMPGYSDRDWIEIPAGLFWMGA